MICISCELALKDNAIKHCFGAKQSMTCACSCVTHTLAEDDIRSTLIRVMTPEAYNDYELLQQVIGELPEQEAKACLMLAVKYVCWILRQTNIDMARMIQDTALYWAGGEDDE